MMRIYLGFFILFLGIPFASAQDVQPLHLSLKEAVSIASKQNAQVLAAHQRVLEALANISVNQADLLPQVSGVFGGKRQSMDLRSSGINIPGDPHVGPFNSFDTRGRLTMAIFDPQAVGRLKSAQAGKKLSQAQLIKVKQDVLALVASMFLEAQRSEQAVELMDISLKESRKFLEVLENRLAQGTASQTDVNQVKANFASAEYLYEAAKVRANETHLALASALKIPLDQKIVFEEDQSWMDGQLQQAQMTPDEAVAQAQLDQSKTQEFEVKRGMLPKITAAGDLGRQGESIGNSSNTYSLGIQVSVPVWEGGSKQAKIEQAKAKIKEDEILLSDVMDQSQIKIRMALDNLTKAKAFLKAQIERLNFTTQQLAIDQNRLKTGLGDVLDTYRAESQRALAIDEKNEAQALYWTAKINLAHVMGKIEEMFDIKEKSK